MFILLVCVVYIQMCLLKKAVKLIFMDLVVCSACDIGMWCLWSEVIMVCDIYICDMSVYFSGLLCLRFKVLVILVCGFYIGVCYICGL